MCNILNNSLLFPFDKTCIYSKKLLGELEKINQQSSSKSPINLEAVKDATTFIIKYHADQVRKSGEPFYSHPLKVASIVASYLPKTEIIIVAILHDVVEDTEIENSLIKYLFGKSVSKIVEMVTDLNEELDLTFKPNEDFLLYKKIKTSY